MGRLRFGIDVGGTFTDVVARDEASGRLVARKVPTRPGRQEQSVVAGLEARLGPTDRVAGIVHGTTVVTNAILEGRGAKVALVTTRGFRDVLEIGRQNREALYELVRPGRPEPLVPRHLRFEVDERTGADGEVLRPPRPDELAALAERVRATGAEAVAVCLLHAYANPEHERAVVAALRGAAPYVCASSEVNAEFREFERTSTVVLNALVLPIIDRYVAALGEALAAHGREPEAEGGHRVPPLHFVQSSGGMLSAEATRRQPLRMVMSGPAAGVAAARYALAQLSLDDAVSFDMGGTSTDVCLIAGGRAETVRERTIEGRPLRAPSVAVESIGAGGGSVAWLDAVGALKVGPRSAGARPGPACYGLGGEEPTVTDANVALGYIRPDLVFGDAIQIDRERAQRAIEQLAARLGLEPLAAAHGILEIADANMMRAIRLVSVQRGYDLRRFSLIAFGGAGPLHAGRLARALGIPRVIVPAHSSVFSALGCLVSDLRYDAVQTYRARLSSFDAGEVERRFAALEQEARAPLLVDEQPEAIVLARSMDLRYAGQNYELEVPVEPGFGPAAIRDRFNDRHRALYTYATDEDVELVNLRVVATVQAATLPAERQPAGGPARAFAEHEAYFPGLGLVRTPVYRRAEVGQTPLTGPAIVEDEQSTILVLPEQQIAADDFGNLMLESAAEAAGPATTGDRRGADPITLEVVRSAVDSIAEEMRVIVMRSARSPLLKEAGDLSNVLTDAQGRMIAQGNRDIPIHLGVMGFTIKELLKQIPAEALRPGDVIFTNSPAVGGNHLPDVKAIEPIFFEDRLVAFAVSLSHWPDVGGALPGSYVPWATELIQEGLHITPIRLFDRDGPIDETLDCVLANLRGRVERRGDIFAQRAATGVAGRRLLELFGRYGREVVLACFERFMEESDLRVRAALCGLPDGTYSGEDFLDDDGLGHGPIAIRVAMTVDGDRARFDFSGSDPQVAGPLNTTAFIAAAGVYYTCKALLDPDLSANDGCYRALEVFAPFGTLLNPGPDAPVVGGNHETAQRVADAVFKAFARVVPERVVAGGITTSGLALFTGRWPDGRAWTLYEVHGGGEGARLGRDGTNAVRVHMTNVMNTPTEVIEAEYPLLVERHELREDSGGAGRWRGGLGLRRAYRLVSEQARLTTMMERLVVPPWGLFGGADGRGGRATLQRGGQTRELRGKESLELVRDDVIVVETAGGGGYGDPAEREPELVERDRFAGYVAAPGPAERGASP